MQKITTCLWFKKNNGEEAANYYVETFNSAPNSSHNGKILTSQKTPEAAAEISGRPAGSLLTIEFELDGARFLGLNGGPVEGFNFSPATSFIVDCETQEEIDHFWKALSAVPEAEQCGWCTDRFGITWQIVPKILTELMSDPATSEKVTAAFMPMKKLNIEELKKAAE